MHGFPAEIKAPFKATHIYEMTSAQVSELCCPQQAGCGRESSPSPHYPQVPLTWLRAAFHGPLASYQAPSTGRKMQLYFCLQMEKLRLRGSKTPAPEHEASLCSVLESDSGLGPSPLPLQPGWGLAAH